MFVMAMRGLAAAAAAAVIVVTCFWPADTGGEASQFGKVLENVAQADVVHLKITRDGKAGELWVRRPEQADQPSQLRWNHADGTYTIAHGKRLWLVDEKANRAAPGPSPYFREDRSGLDLLALLDLPAEGDRQGLLGARPAEKVERDGRTCDVYRMEVAAADGELRIEALVDTRTRMLRTVETTTRRDGRVRPITTLDVLEVDKPVDDSLFIVGDTLTEDGRVGKVTDVQGIVSVKPVMHRRWTPVAAHMLLKPGDWVRTDVRGANAVALRLVKETNVTLGPESLVEVVKPSQLRLFDGVIQVAADPNAPVELLGPGQQKIQIKGKEIYRLDQQKLVRLEKAPLWLQGFEGATANESIGSLVAKVEGRDVPLTVGYHKVSVEIRDQIARTVIEESFANHTKDRLEGVFYFPLPQDASISGFGMWIGNELVEADVVEKQRAREIYETILRERRDPGLLEWTGGNIFKARVFPIEAHSEKRIKITYTQVLPLRGNGYRYSYALQSELLKQHPLRELAIDVKLSSVMPLRSVTSPTHPTRIDTTQHSAHVEFAAQEYTPTRDFEVVVELAGDQSNVVLIPHRRGEDGYFMLLLTPPAAGTAGLSPAPEGEWQREVLPDSKPLELLILADTSGSIDAGGREVQSAFIASLLGALTREDKINLACCDVGCDWAFKSPVPADEKNVQAARDLLAGRVSLGWTDLDKAFASALKQCGPNTRVIYVGDGIVTTGDADPVAFAKRLKLLYQEEGKSASCHAVAVSSSFEPMVLKAIASLGGGSVRQITGERTPQAVALELLGEVTKPTIRDLKVQFTGIRSARVYPGELPNLAAGTQQILLGRYLPEGRDQQGEVIVTGMQGNQPVRFQARVSLADAEQGNSFIPRLWARMHLDALLEQGASAAIKDEIIALSEEYNIITPYTSLLVLESDADRERFKVKRRFQMRDAEKFFAEGTDKVDYELVQQQMRRAGDWRLGLRRSVLRELMGLGRDIRVFQPQPGGGRVSYNKYLGRRGGMAGGEYEYGGGDRLWLAENRAMSGPMSRSGLASPDMDYSGGQGTRDGDLNGRFALPGEDLFAADKEKALGGEFEEGLDSLGDRDLKLQELAGEPMDESYRMLVGDRLEESELAAPASRPSAAPFLAAGRYDMGSEITAGARARRISSYKPISGYIGGGWKPRQPWPGQYTSWLGTLFPYLPPAPEKEKPFEPEKPWPAPARELAQGLLRTGQLAGLQGGLRIDREIEGFDPRWNELTSRSQTLELVSPAAWLVRSGGSGSQTTVQWCDRQQRGVFSKAFQLGRLRKSTPLDLAKPPLGLPGHLLTPLDRTYQNYTVELKPQADGQTLLVLKHPQSPDAEIHILVDTARKVVLSIENRQDGKPTATTKFDQFVEVAGSWWAGRSQTLDKEGRRTSATTEKLQLVAADAFDQQVKEQLAGRERIQFLGEPQVKLVDAKRAFSQGKATFDDQMTLLLHFCDSQQWPRVLEHLKQAEKLAGDKPGFRWVRSAILNASRRREELRQRVLEEAARLAKPQAGDSEELYLADYLVGQGSGVLEANEMLAVLDALKHIYGRQPEYLLAMKRWAQNRVNYLQQAGQPAEALQLQAELAKEYPHDSHSQQQYAQALANVGEYDAAYAWLGRVITDEAKWQSYEEDSLRRTYTQLLQNQGRWPEMADYLARWVERRPEPLTAYQEYLSALMRTNQIDKANALMAAWLKEGRQAGKLPPGVAQRLQAAAFQALGQGYGMHTNRIDQQWLDPLAETAWFFWRQETQSNLATQIMGHGQFQQSDQCRQLRQRFVGTLAAEIGSLKPAEIDRLVNWIWPNDPAVEADVWRRIATGLQTRWSAESDPEIKHQLAQPLVRILSGRLSAEEHLAFLRKQLQEGPKKYHAFYATQLFNALLGQPWSAEHEDEAFGLLEKLSDAGPEAGTPPAQRLLAQVQALYRLTDAQVQARYDARMAKVEHQEELSRTELRAKQEENLRLAREEFADRLRKARGEHPQALAQWINVERLYLETLLGQNLDTIEQECWELLGPKPPKPLSADTEPDLQQQLDEILRSRHLITLANLAARDQPSVGARAKPELIDRLLGYVDQAIAQQDPKDPQAGAPGWKYSKYQLLVALDRPKELAEDLKQWVRVDDPDNFWRVSLGYLLAEQGQIAEAVTLLEAVEADDELAPSQYRTLAAWYMVLDRSEQHEEALIAVFKAMEEWRLSNWISAKLQPWQRRQPEGTRQLPPELDKDVLRAFAALFRKSGSPQDHLWRLREFYQATRDFRLLTGLADAVVGHTAAKVYPFLQGMDSVFSEIRDEATVDSIVEQIGKVRARAKTTVDQRALDLLEAIVERRAAEVLNQPGPHVDKALAALRRAFKGEGHRPLGWSPGEPRLMADLLAGLGRITQPKLAEEQIRQLVALHDGAAAGTLDRMHIGHAQANCLWNYGRQDEAIDLLQAVLDEYQAAQGGVLPAHANDALGSFVSYLESRGHHARGENVLFGQLKHPVNQQQTYWLRQRLYQLYQSAIATDGGVSLGSGLELYRVVQRKIQDELDTPDYNHRYNLVNRLCDVYRVARDKKLAGHVDDLRAFAFKRLPEVLKRQTNNYQSIVSRVAETLHELAGARDGLAFLVERLEGEPAWLRYSYEDGWNQHGWRLGQWRTEAKQLDAGLEERLLKIVVTELRWDLDSRQSRNRAMYYRHNSYYWAEKEKDFRQAAEEVYEKRKTSGAAVQYIADYLYHGLDHFDRAIEVLFIAHGEKRLDEGGQSKLVQFLHGRSRYGESIAILQPLVELRPDNMQYRVWLMHAYFQTKRPAELLALLKQTDEYFHREGRWREAPLAALAKSCLDNQLYEQSVAYYEELIPLHQRTQPRRGIGNGTLSSYYGYMAGAYAGLKNTAKAVDAACGAIVSWGPTHQNRAEALKALNQVLRDARDLDGYVGQLDKQVAESGLQNPLVRKALGIVYAERKEYAKAIAQLRLACEVQPNDAETHRQLVACYDQQGDKQGAVRQLLASLQLSQRDVQLYKDLGRRLGELNQPAEMERAYTSIVEMLSNESESHTLLAEIRQEQNRWDDAIVHWQQVARIRALEPTGLLKLAAAQIHQRQWDAATETLRQLDAKGWPSRFGDVHNEVRQLERQIEEGRKGWRPSAH